MPTLTPVDYDPFAQPNASAPPDALVPGTIPYYDNFAQPAAKPQPPDMSYGYTPSQSLENPVGGLAPSTKKMMVYDMLTNGGKGMQSILRQDPSVVTRSAYASAAGKGAQGLANLRDALGSYESLVDHFRDVGVRAGPDVLPLAIGPDYTDREHPPAPDNSWLPSVSGMATGIAKSYAALEAPPGKGLGVLNGADTGSNAYVANNAELYGSHDPQNPNAYDKALDVNTRLGHLNDAIAMVYKALPLGAQGSSTDQAQGIVKEMVKAAIHAKTPDAFFNVINEAKMSIAALKRQLGANQAIAPEPGLPSNVQWHPEQAAQLAHAATQGRTSFLPQAPSQQPLRNVSINPKTGHKIGWNGSAWVDAP